MTTIEIRTDQPYQAVLGRDIVLSELERALEGANQVLVIHQPAMARTADAIKAALGDRILLAEVPDAEAAKRIEVAQFLWQILGQADFTRSDMIVGLGGGAVTDLAGFVAATWLRGIGFVLVPTSALGLVDASIGGKTGINTEQGKNLVGAFHHPSRVIGDFALLDSLPRNELLTGFAEVAKAGFIADPMILDIIEANPGAATDSTTTEFAEVVERAIRVKANVVAEDFQERGLREILNYGHTLGHAIEHTERYKWRHGAAVAIGMMYAAELGHLAGRLSAANVERHHTVLELLELPQSYPVGRWNTLLATMRRDKKARGSMLRFIVLDDIAKPRVLEGPDESLLFTAYQSLAD